MPYNSRDEVVRLFAERYDIKSNEKLDPNFKCSTCLATLKICDTTKQSVCGYSTQVSSQQSAKL